MMQGASYMILAALGKMYDALHDGAVGVHDMHCVMFDAAFIMHPHDQNAGCIQCHFKTEGASGRIWPSQCATGCQACTLSIHPISITLRFRLDRIVE